MDETTLSEDANRGDQLREVDDTSGRDSKGSDVEGKVSSDTLRGVDDLAIAEPYETHLHSLRGVFFRWVDEVET